jgi:hypothetical protein
MDKTKKTELTQITRAKLENKIFTDFQNEKHWEEYINHLKTADSRKNEILQIGRRANKTHQDFLRYFESVSEESDKEWLMRFDVFG